MLKKLILCCTLLTVATQLAATEIKSDFMPTDTPQTSKIDNTEQLNATINKFLYHKKADDVYAIADYLSKGNTLNEETRFPMVGFFMGVKNENEQLFNEIKKQSYSQNMKETLEKADNSAEGMKKFLGQELPAHSETPEFLSILWGYFYATGDKRILEKMCEMEKRTLSKMFRLRVIYTYEANMGKFPDIIEPCP